MNYQYLYFETFNQLAPGFESNLQVFAEKNTVINGFEFKLCIIGDSHFIGSQALGFHELCSCKELESYQIKLKVSDFAQTDFVTQNAAFTATTKIWVEAMSKTNWFETYDLEYAFGHKAITGIKMLDSGYETIHTYPEFKASVYSRTIFSF